MRSYNTNRSTDDLAVVHLGQMYRTRRAHDRDATVAHCRQIQIDTIRIRNLQRFARLLRERPLRLSTCCSNQSIIFYSFLAAEWVSKRTRKGIRQPVEELPVELLLLLLATLRKSNSFFIGFGCSSSAVAFCVD